MQIKWKYYLITFVLALIFFIFEGARPTHYKLDSPLVYGDFGHIVLLILTFIVSMYFGATNTNKKWLYPFSVVLFIYVVVPYVALIFINQPEVTDYYFTGFLIYGFIFVFIPHLVVPLLGMGLGCLIYRIHKHVSALTRKANQ